jgi:probable F420-dependent oxidoreductase
MRQLEFAFPIYPYNRARNPDDLARIVRRADELGYFSVGFPEHLLPPPQATETRANEHYPDVPTLIAYLAATTDRIRFEIGVSVLPYHPPIQYAKQLATLDVVTKGRLILGVGTGWFEEEFERLGLPFAERGAITDEYLRGMIELWTSDRPTFSGKYVSFRDVTFLPKPVQKPHMPIFVGGTGTRPAHRTAELGAGWHPMVGTVEERAAFFQGVKQLTAEHGRDREALWFAVNLDLVLDPATQQGTLAPRVVPRHVSAPRYANMSTLHSDQAIAAIEQEQAAGVNLISIGMRWDTVDDLIAGLEHFAAQIIPNFR